MVAADPANTYHAVRLAQRYALDVMAYAGSEWPQTILAGDNPEDNLVSERLLDSGMSFAINARRYLEHTGQKPTIVEQRYTAVDSSDDAIETRLYEALHGLVHSRVLRIQYSPLSGTKYINEQGFVPVYFLYQTDKFPEKRVSIFDMAWTYLTLPTVDFSMVKTGA